MSQDPLNSEALMIRNATMADVPLLAALHVATFNETHGSHPNGPTIELRQYQWQNIFQAKDGTWFCLVMEDSGGNLVGFAKGQPYQYTESLDFAGELNKIYLLNKYHKKGLGKQLLCKVAQEFISRGISSMLLFGDANSPSNGFYERMGGEKLFAKNGEFHGGYGWKDLRRVISNCE